MIHGHWYEHDVPEDTRSCDEQTVLLLRSDVEHLKLFGIASEPEVFRRVQDALDSATDPPLRWGWGCSACGTRYTNLDAPGTTGPCPETGKQCHKQAEATNDAQEG